MRSQSSRWARLRSLPWGLLFALALIAVVERSLKRHDLDFTSIGGWDWRLRGGAAKKIAPTTEVLCLGDSLMKMGVLPAIVRQRTGLQTSSLCMCQAQAPATYFLLRRALGAGARPKAIVVDYKPYFLARGPELSETLWPELLDFRECLEMASTAGNASLFARLALAKVFPSIRLRSEIRANLLAALEGRSASHRYEMAAYARNWRRNEGAMVMQVTGYQGEFDPATPVLFPPAWRCERTNAVYVRRFLDLASVHGIAVYWLLPPMLPEVQARREQLGQDAGCTRFLKRLQADYANLSVLDARRSGYDAALFFDPLHLTQEGTVVLSAGVADALKAHGPGADSGRRWVALPRFERPTGERMPETMAQSEEAIRRLRESRRR